MSRDDSLRQRLGQMLDGLPFRQRAEGRAGRIGLFPVAAMGWQRAQSRSASL
jgi:hypothetical protein